MKKNKKIKKKREGEKKRRMVKKRKERAEKRQEKEQLGEGGKKVEKRCTWVRRDEKKEEGIR